MATRTLSPPQERTATPDRIRRREPEFDAPEPSRWPLVRDGLALAAIVLGVFLAIVLVAPAEGVVITALQDSLGLVLGHGGFTLPLALILVGALVIIQAAFPERSLPLTRLVGAGLIVMAGLPAAHMLLATDVFSIERAWLGDGGGLVGHWLSTGLQTVLGAFGTAVLLVITLAVGLLLLLDLTVTQVVQWTWDASAWLGPRVGKGLGVAGRASWIGVRAGSKGVYSGGSRAARAAHRALANAQRVRRPAPGRRLSALAPHASRINRRGALALPPAPVAEEAPWVRASVRGLPHAQAVETYATPDADRHYAGRSDEFAVEPWTDEAMPATPLAPRQGSASRLSFEPPHQAISASLDGASTAVRPLVAATPADAPRWQIPAADVFQALEAEPVDPAHLEARSRVIEETLASFNISARVIEANQGPAVTQFGIEPAAGVAVNRILSRQNDLALRLGVSPIRMEAPVPGKRVVGVEVPNAAVATVTVRDVVDSPEWERASGRLRLALGRDVSGKAIVGDLGRMPHLLIAGATGAGKSVCINTIIGSLLYAFSPDELQLLLIDPKRVELVGFADTPHLRLPVITDMDKVVGALKWVVLEMETRYKLFAEHGVRNLDGYNRLVNTREPAGAPLPYLVVVIDELADMMMTAAEEVEKTLCRLAQLARATGIHLVVATQRPSVDVLTGLIKANFPTRMAFAVSSQTDSRVILDQAGADKLLGRGDALFMPTDAMKPIRLQGAFVSDEEMNALVRHWKAQGAPRYSAADLEQIEALGKGEDDDDDVYDRGVELAEQVGRLSVSLLQRRLGIGRDRAQRLLDRLIDEGIAED